MEYVVLGLAALGWLVSAVGNVWLLVVAFRESVGWGLACLLVPCAQLVFVIKFWEDAKRPFLIGLLGTALAVAPPIAYGAVLGARAAAPFDVDAVEVPDLPADRGPARPMAPGVVRHEVLLGYRRDGYYDPPGHGGRLWLYLPEGAHAPGSLPCVLIAGAGTSGFTGMLLGPGDEPEHLPWAAEGVAVLAYELDGPLPQRERLTRADLRKAYAAYRDAQAGLANARIALEWALARAPELDPKAIYACGHSSAGAVALDVAAHEPRLAGAIAFAPQVELEPGDDEDDLPGVYAFARKASPVYTAEKLARRPVYLFNARDDGVCPASECERLAAALRRAGADVTLELVDDGGHRDAMLERGLPGAIAWLQARHATRRPAPTAATAAAAPEAAAAAPPEAPAASSPGPTEAADLVRKAASHDPAIRYEAVIVWLQGEHDRPDGARRAILEAVGPRAEGSIDGLLARSVRDHPPAAREALACLPLAPPQTRAALVARVVRPDAGLPKDDVAAALQALPDDRELSLEEALVRLGRPREGCARRLLLARGVEWARTPPGKALLDALPAERVADLLGAEEETLRALGARLLAARGADAALGPLGALLGDPTPAVRQEAAGALESLHDARAGAALARALLAEADEPTRSRLRRALAALPEGPTGDAFVTLLGAPAVDDRLAAVLGLEALHPIAGIRPLAGAARDPERRVALAALKALAGLRGSRVPGVRETVDQQAPDLLAQVALHGRDDEVKRAARHLYYEIRRRLPEQDAR